MGVFDVKGGKAIVKNANKCTSCRECIRECNGFNNDIELGKIRNHFICIILIDYFSHYWISWII